MRTVAVRGEELGFDYMAFPEHIVAPRAYTSVHPSSETGRLPAMTKGYFLDSLTVMTYVAAVTTKPRLMPTVMVVPYRPAVMTAKMLATMDVLSGGRVTVGCGVGWLEEEFEALGTPPLPSVARSRTNICAPSRNCGPAITRRCRVIT